MTSPSDPRTTAAPPSPATPSTQEIPVVPAEHASERPADRPAEPVTPAPVVPPAPVAPTTGTPAPAPLPAPGDAPRTGSGAAVRPARPPAPGQRPPQPVSAGAAPPPVHPLQPVAGPATGAQPAATPAPASVPPAWPDTLADDPAPPTRPATDALAPTGPVDYVPGLPGVGTAAPPKPERTRGLPTRAGAVRDRAALAGIGLAALAVLLLQFGLVHGTAELWSAVTLWSVFATAATVLVLLALAARVVAGSRVSAPVATRVAGAGVLGLAIFWLLVILPIVASDPGFLVTAALLAAGGALWIGPRTER